MKRSHIIEETIEDSITRSRFVEFLKNIGKIPSEWDMCSILVEQETRADEIKIIAKRIYVKNKI